jgi:hypothetical protein
MLTGPRGPFDRNNGDWADYLSEWLHPDRVEVLDPPIVARP